MSKRKQKKIEKVSKDVGVYNGYQNIPRVGYMSPLSSLNSETVDVDLTAKLRDKNARQIVVRLRHAGMVHQVTLTRN